MSLKHTELKTYSVFKSQLGIRFNSDNYFGESREIEQVLKSIDFIVAMGELKEKKGEVEESHFDQDFLIHRFLGLSIKDMELNDVYKKKDEEEGGSELSGAGSGSSYTPESTESGGGGASSGSDTESSTPEASTEEAPAAGESAPAAEAPAATTAAAIDQT
jgi:hypothetical protein